ncbi:MAG: four helix bundle protein [Patescibacteria group bacterium]
MNQLNFIHTSNPPRPALLPILQKAKSAYLLWYQYYPIIPKTHRYSLGQKIDNLFVNAIEAITTAGFLNKEEKLPYVRLARRKIDTLKIFLMMCWETKSLDDKKYIALSLKIDELGKMLGGWQGQLVKQTRLKLGG